MNAVVHAAELASPNKYKGVFCICFSLNVNIEK